MKHVKLFEQFINEGFKNKKDFEKFLEEIDGMGESQIRKIMGKDYIDTPGFYQDEKEDYDGIVDFMTSNMAKSEFEELKAYWEKHVAESLNEGRIALNHVYANAPVRNKVLEILRNGRVSEQDFMAAVSKAGAPTKWINRNSHFFKVEEEDGVKYYSLTKSGHVIMSALNESEVLEIYEEFGLEENLIVDPLDITKDFFYVSINGKVYGYQAKPGGNIEDVATTFKKMLKYSAGKALAWLKKNTELALGAGGSGPLRESDDLWRNYKKNPKTEAGPTEPYRKEGAPVSGDPFIDFMMEEMWWNTGTNHQVSFGPEINRVEKGGTNAEFMKKIIGVKDGWSEAYQYKCRPGSSVLTELKNAVKKFGKPAEVKKSPYGSQTLVPWYGMRQVDQMVYFIIFR
jgi:hypothetical protein